MAARSLRLRVVKRPAVAAVNVRRETGDAFAGVVHDSHLPDGVAPAADLRQQPHALGDVEAGSPEIDDVTAGSQRSGLFHDRGLQAVLDQPIGEGRAGDAGAGDQNIHDRRAMRLVRFLRVAHLASLKLAKPNLLDDLFESKLFDATISAAHQSAT
jgi:hypothetical protein